MLATRLILGSLATLDELRTVYSYKDMIYLNEVLNLKEEQEYLSGLTPDTED